MKIRFLILFISLVIFSPAIATHIVGGELLLLYTGKGNQYEIRLHLYFDQINGSPAAQDDNAIVAFYEKGTNELMGSQNLELYRSNEYVEYVNPECFEDSPQIITRILRYRKLITLDPDRFNHDEGYYVVWERCCRNEVISNIQAPESTGSVFYLEFPSLVKDGETVRNSTPVFEEPFGEFACVGRDFESDFSAIDVDGDSLVYEMVTPYRGYSTDGSSVIGPGPVPFPGTLPFPQVNWNPGFGPNNAVLGNPSLGINSQTGKLSVNPSMEGLFVFGVKLSEFRDGEQIGEVWRDYQMTVLPTCPENAAPVLALENGEGNLISQNDTVEIDLLDDVCLNLLATDSVDQVTLSAIPDGFDFINFEIGTEDGGNEVTFTQRDTLVSTICWDSCAGIETEYYSVSFVAEDNGCPLPVTDTFQVVFHVTKIPNDTPTVQLIPNVDSVNVEVGDSLVWLVVADDVDGDKINLSMAIEGGNDPGEHITFESKSGSPVLESEFKWIVDCEDLSNEPYEITFTSFHDYCFGPLHSSKTVVVNVFEIVPEQEPFEPSNVFTPNGDGVNDSFVMPDLPASICEDEFVVFEIYNRWGERVYYSDDTSFEWFAKGTPDGIYFYHIAYERTTYKGWVQVIR